MNYSRISHLNPASILLVASVTAVSFHSPALAFGFTGEFAPSNFTVANNNADGSVDTNNAASGTVILTGGNNNIFPLAPGTTTWITISPITQGGTVSFNWSFAGDNYPYNGSVGDRGGYIINGNPTYLATRNGDNGNTSLSLTAGQTFGFIVQTAENTGSAGVLTIEDFDFTPQSIPEPLTFIGAGVVLGALPILKKEYAKRNKKKDKDS